MQSALSVQFGSVALTIQCDFDLILSRAATFTRKYNFTSGSVDSMKYIFVTELILSNSRESTAMTIVSIGKKLQDLGDRVHITATDMDNYSNANSALLASDKFCEIYIFVCNDRQCLNYNHGISKRHLNIQQQHFYHCIWAKY